MGCNASSNTRNKTIKSKTQYKGQFKDKVVEDVDKRKQVQILSDISNLIHKISDLYYQFSCQE